MASLPPYLQKTVTQAQLNQAIERINRHLPDAQRNKENAFAPLAYEQLDALLLLGGTLSLSIG